jgi:hypothetical protein
VTAESEGRNMGIREISARFIEPLAMWTMVIGIVALCQPWSELLHRYGVTITLAGLVVFSIFSHIKPAADADRRD